MKHSLEKWGRAPIILGGLEHPLFWEGMSTHYSKSNQLEKGWTNAKWIMKEKRFMKCSLEKWGRAPIILGGLEHPLFWGLEHPFSRRARALTIQRGTSTHCSKTNKQRASEQLQNGHERNKFMKCSLEKMRARTHYFWGLEHPSFWGLEHPFSRRAWALIIQRAIKWRTGEQMQNESWKKKGSWNSLLKNGGAHPLF